MATDNTKNNDSLRIELYAADTSSSVSIPLSGNTIHAGFPSPATDYMMDSIDLNRVLIRRPETTFFARVKGDSMQDARIFDGDLAIIDKSIEAHNGSYVVAFIDGEFTIKEFRRDPNSESGWLIPHNKNYQPIRITADNQFLIWGVITHVIHSV